MTVAVLAGLTLKEALRRRLLVSFAAITLFLVVLSAWGFGRLSHAHSLTSGEHGVGVAGALILFMFMFSFILALSASAIGSPAVASDIESGVILTVVTRPVRRTDVLVGKWLGLLITLAGYTVAVCGLETLAVEWVSGYVPPNPLLVGVYLFVEGALLLTVTVLLSTRFSAMAAGVTGVAIFGAAWLAGVVGSMGKAFNIPAMRTVSDVARYVVPTDAMWHGAIFYLQPRVLFANERPFAGPSPFFSSRPPTTLFLVWTAVWLVGVMAAAVVSFSRREL